MNGQKEKSMRKFSMDLRYFGEDGAMPADAGTGSETAEAGAAAQAAEQPQQAPVSVSPRVAAEMERQRKAHPERYQQPAQAQQPQVDAQAEQKPAQAQPPQEAQDLQSRWEAAKKGEFAEMYGRDVQKAIQDRFKNQKDLSGEMDKLEPMLAVLRERAGVESNDDLIAQVMDDDSLYEDAANEAGMTVEAYKKFLAFQREHDEHVREAEERQWMDTVNSHYMELARQAEAMKEKFLNFDLDTELQNQEFLKLTSPEVGVSVEAAYYAIHYKDLAPQMMAYGMKRAQSQMAQTIQANGARPREGGLNSRSTAADMTLNFKAMDRKDRNRIYEMIHSGRQK